jgi:hypothetical protein
VATSRQAVGPAPRRDPRAAVVLVSSPWSPPALARGHPRADRGGGPDRGTHRTRRPLARGARDTRATSSGSGPTGSTA